MDWKSGVLFVTLAGLLVARASVAGQDSRAPQSQQQDVSDDGASESVVTDEHRAVWRLAAEVALDHFDFGEAEPKIVEVFVKIRARHMDAQDYYRDEWRAERERLIQQSRQTGGLGSGFFDQSDLRYQLSLVTRRERQKLARELVQMLEKEQAEQLYPYLGGFDFRIDAVINHVRGFELADEDLRKSVDAVLQYQIDANQARVNAARDDGDYGTLIRQAREKCVASLRPHLDEVQLQKIAKLIGASA